MPGAGQDGAVGRDHVDDRADDVMRRGTGCGQDRQGVRHDLVDLGAEVTGPDNLLVGVPGAQAREMGGAAGFGDRQVGVSGGGVKTFGLMRRNLSVMTIILFTAHAESALREINRRPDALTHAM
jgi:hypothetical protein